MARPCTVCVHKDRAAIDEALLSGEPFRRVAARTGLSATAVRRHFHNDLAAHLREAKHADRVLDADVLLGQIESLQERTLTILTKAERKGNLSAALGAIREARSNTELLAKLTGSLIERRAIAATLNHATLPDVQDAADAFAAAIAAVHSDPAAQEPTHDDPR